MAQAFSAQIGKCRVTAQVGRTVGQKHPKLRHQFKTWTRAQPELQAVCDEVAVLKNLEVIDPLNPLLAVASGQERIPSLETGRRTFVP